MKSIRLLAVLLVPLLLVGCRQTEQALPTEERPPTEEIYGCPARSLKGLTRQEVYELYLQALDEGEREAYTPVVVYVNDTLTEMIEYYYQSAGSPEAYRDAVLAEEHSDGAQRLQTLYQALEDLIEPKYLEISASELEEYLAAAGRKSDCFPAVSLAGTPYLLQVPTQRPWEIFAWIPFCGWNSCPDVEDMMAICKYWQEQYGALPAQISYDTLSFYLPEPVTDRETAIALAREQVAFCDGVFEMGTPAYYAAAALDSHFWSFWWD